MTSGTRALYKAVCDAHGADTCPQMGSALSIRAQAACACVYMCVYTDTDTHTHSRMTACTLEVCHAHKLQVCMHVSLIYSMRHPNHMRTSIRATRRRCSHFLLRFLPPQFAMLGG